MNRLTRCTLLLAMMTALGPGGFAQQASPALTLPQARAALEKAEASFPENSKEVAAALNGVIGLEADQGVADASTLLLLDRLLKVEEKISGPRSEAYMAALDSQADVLLGLSRAPEARADAEKAFAIGQKDFPNSSDTDVAAGTLGRICSTLGDVPCALRAQQFSVDLARRTAGPESAELVPALSNLGTIKGRSGDVKGAIEAQEEALAIAYRVAPNDNHVGVIENNLGSNYLKAQNFPKATEHLNRAVAMLSQLYGANSPRLMQVNRNLAALYTRTGQFPEAWKAFDFSLRNTYAQIDSQATDHAMFAQSLAQGGDPSRALSEGLTSARLSRETFVLQARTLPERQALAYDAVRPHGLDTAISVALVHRDLSVADLYQEMVRSRALVADEMARRQKNLNADNDPETGRLLEQLDKARADLLAAEHLPATSPKSADAVVAATSRMEAIERTLAERSSRLRADERIYQVTTSDLRSSLPAHAVLLSYVLYQRSAVDKRDPALASTPSYAAFILHPDTGDIRLFDLGPAAAIDALVLRARAAADDESHSHGLGSMRNERMYREAALALRERVWDPLRKDLGSTRFVLLVADGNLNLIPFASLPEGKGYLVEHGPVIHTLSSERDLVPADEKPARLGLLAIGSPSFGLAPRVPQQQALRGATPTCETFSKIDFPPLPGTALEVSDIGSTWRRWNHGEPSQVVTGDAATLASFLNGAAHNRVLHLATHAFLLEKSCGSGNPLLHSGLVFAGGRHGEAQSILTAQQVASLDLSGVDWAVLSACNTGNGELRDGEGVLGLERAFRVAGARSVIMTLWPVDDTAARRFMHRLYTERLQLHASTADAVWNSAQQVLLERRAAGQSTHPWYWAGFIGSGGWK